MPRIAEIKCQRIQFQSGDRILVKTYHNLTIEQQRKLRKSISKWAGCEVEIFFVNVLQMDLVLPDKNGELSI